MFDCNSIVLDILVSETAQVQCCGQHGELAAASIPNKDAKTHQMPACSSAVIHLRGRRNHGAVLVAHVEAWAACVLVLYDNADELPCSVQEGNCSCLPQSGCQTHVGQQIPVAMPFTFDGLHSLLELQAATKRSQNASAAIEIPRTMASAGHSQLGRIRVRCSVLQVGSRQSQNVRSLLDGC